MTEGRPVSLIVRLVLATVALVIALSVSTAAHGLALYAYVLFVGFSLLLLLMRKTRHTLPTTPSLRRLLARRQDPDETLHQLEVLTRELSAGTANASELHRRLRPTIHEIATARLSRRHGVDLAREPERAQRAVGNLTWDLVRPEREPPANPLGSGLSGKQLTQLVDELEEI